MSWVPLAMLKINHRSRGSLRESAFPTCHHLPSGRSRSCRWSLGAVAAAFPPPHAPAAPPVGCRRNYTKGEMLDGREKNITEFSSCRCCCFLVCLVLYTYIYTLVNNCHSFVYIFAWKPRNFEVIIIWREGVIFPFQEHSSLPWQNLSFKPGQCYCQQMISNYTVKNLTRQKADCCYCC